MEIFIKGKGCKCDPNVRKMQEFSMFFCYVPLLTFVLSLMKAFPIAKEYYNGIELELISKKIYADKLLPLLIILIVFWLFNLPYNAAVYNCNIKKMKKFSIINFVFSICFFVAFTVYIALKGFEMEFAGFLIIFSTVMSAFLELMEVGTQKNIEKNRHIEDIES
ncbi:MAG: hypothetical protein IKI29_02420 [Clostridia bacterium]|nr:hypothetical protein [Clostridia bacterium]